MLSVVFVCLSVMPSVSRITAKVNQPISLKLDDMIGPIDRKN